MSGKIDYKKKLKSLYSPPKDKPVIINVPALNYLMIDGMGVPGECKEYQDALESLFAVSFKTKFTLKNEAGFDYAVMPLEGLWWADNMDNFVNGNKEKWKWTMMIMQPEKVTKNIINKAIEEIKKKKPGLPLDKLRLENYKEGTSAQIMHIGPYSEEHENIMKIHDLIKKNGGKFDGKKQKHHEIYLSDPRKCTPEKLKTILRQPFIK